MNKEEEIIRLMEEGMSITDLIAYYTAQDDSEGLLLISQMRNWYSR
jgi:hypothetical protein